MLKFDSAILQCDDYRETLVFIRDRSELCESGYEFLIQDGYAHNYYESFWGRLKLAWRTFKGKPTNYTGIYTEDKEKVKNFLEQCLNMIYEDEV